MVSSERRIRVEPMEQAKQEYLSSRTSLTKLAQKYDLKEYQLRKIAKQEGWRETRKNTPDTLTLLERATAELKQQREDTNIFFLAQQLMSVLESAIEQGSRCYVKNKHRIVTTEYDTDVKKPSREEIKELEELIPAEGMVDTMSIKRLTSALKDIQDILNEKEAGDCGDSGVVVLSEVEE